MKVWSPSADLNAGTKQGAGSKAMCTSAMRFFQAWSMRFHPTPTAPVKSHALYLTGCLSCCLNDDDFCVRQVCRQHLIPWRPMQVYGYSGSC